MPHVIELGAEPGASDDDPSLTGDLRGLYFNSKRAGGAGREDIWFATRATATSPFSQPEPVTALNSPGRETGIAVAPDGSSLWFSSDREGGVGGLDVYLATRGASAGVWSIRLVPELSSAGDDLVSAVIDEGRRVFLARRSDEFDDYDLFVAHRGRDGVYMEPESLQALNGDEAESDACPLAGGVGLVFTRDQDLLFAPGYPDETRSDVQALDALNSDADDRDAWLSDDLRYVAFSSARTGSHRLYEAWRAP